MSQNTWKPWAAQPRTQAVVASAGIPLVNLLRRMVQRWGLVVGLLVGFADLKLATLHVLASGYQTDQQKRRRNDAGWRAAA